MCFSKNFKTYEEEKEVNYFNKFNYIPIEKDNEGDYTQFNNFYLKKRSRLNAARHAKSLINNKYFMYRFGFEEDDPTNDTRQLVPTKAFITAMEPDPDNPTNLCIAEHNPNGLIYIKPKAVIKKNANIKLFTSDKSIRHTTALAMQNKYISKLICFHPRFMYTIHFLDGEYSFVHQSKIDAIVTLDKDEKLIDPHIVDKDFGIDKTVYGVN